MKKRKLSIRQRLGFITSGIEWLAITVIPVYEGEKSTREVFPFGDRWSCFASSIDTALRGYVYEFTDKK